MSSFRCLLLLPGHELPVVQCSYEFSQSTLQRGQPNAGVRSGTINLQLDVPHTDVLLAWAFDAQKKMSGSLVFLQTNQQLVREELTFEDTFCVSYQEIFLESDTGQGAYRCHLQLSASKLVLGASTRDNKWAETR